MFRHCFPWCPTLLRELSNCSKGILIFSGLSMLLHLYSGALSLPTLLGFSLLSVLCLGASSLLSQRLLLLEDDLSTNAMNFLRCRMYSGYSSKLQWFPPLSHRGSYFS
ncbi:hypothetical protein MLD38_012578 [Melastoma candidum]|uniref:Uncharacterized protein n=1 Tax=Melastoma candidum TaxID=119954 RepID=A0ACB9RAF0_9MYRT|nr:hypothetical protein MLD38_012578 [Melastoma candidum]